MHVHMTTLPQAFAQELSVVAKPSLSVLRIPQVSRPPEQGVGWGGFVAQGGWRQVLWLNRRLCAVPG